MVDMSPVYYELIKAGRRTIEEVPDHLQDAVQRLLDEDAARAAGD